MTTETTDPLETVMAAAEKFAEVWNADPMMLPEASERLRLHVQLALLKAKQHGASGYRPWPDGYNREIAALEARLQEE